MTLLESFRRFWPVSLAVLVLVVGGTVLLETGRSTDYTASGTVMIARPEVDPSRVASRAVNLAAAVAETSASEDREALADSGGRDDFRIIQVSDNRAQVLASGEDATPGVRAVLRSLADAVAAQQLASDVPVDERIRPRLFIQVPDDELESLAAVDGRITDEAPEVIGTLVLEDPLAGVENALGGTSRATRLVLLSINSDAGSQALRDTLPDGVDFSVRSNDRQASELLTVTTTGPDPAHVLSAFDVVTGAVDAELQRRQEQAEVPGDARLLVDVIAAPRQARDTERGLSMGALALLVLGSGISVALPTILREIIGTRPPPASLAADAEGDPEARRVDEPAEDDAAGTVLIP